MPGKGQPILPYTQAIVSLPDIGGSTEPGRGLLPSRSFLAKLILGLFLLVSGCAGVGLVYYPCQRLGA